MSINVKEKMEIDDLFSKEDALMQKSPIAYRIWKFILNNIEGCNSLMCSYLVFQEALNISKPTVTRAMKLLKEENFLEIYKSGSSNIYMLKNDYKWNEKGYAQIITKVILTKSEQE